MKLTRERKILVAVLGLGLGALVVDRLFFASPASGPAAATASAVTAVVPGNAPPGLAPAAAASLLDEAVDGSADTIARRLREHAERIGLEPASSRDAFRPAPNLMGQSARHGGAAAALPQPLQVFASTHRLHAVMGVGSTSGNGGGGIAIINGQPYRVGQSVGGLRLTEIRQRSVLLQSSAGSVELSLPDVD